MKSPREMTNSELMNEYSVLVSCDCFEKFEEFERCAQLKAEIDLRLESSTRQRHIPFIAGTWVQERA